MQGRLLARQPVLLMWSVSCVWLDETNQMNQTDQIDQTNEMNQIILPQPVRAAA